MTLLVAILLGLVVLGGCSSSTGADVCAYRFPSVLFSGPERHHPCTRAHANRAQTAAHTCGGRKPDPSARSAV